MKHTINKIEKTLAYNEVVNTNFLIILIRLDLGIKPKSPDCIVDPLIIIPSLAFETEKTRQ